MEELPIKWRPLSKQADTVTLPLSLTNPQLLGRCLRGNPTWTEAGASERHAYFLMDDCSANQTTCELDNIELKFLLPNTTARLQPLDRSTKSFKALMNLRVGTELKVDQLGAIHMMTGAWNSVNQSPECLPASFVNADRKCLGCSERR
ncbi:hypothetical protein HPB48_013092 [Haemaphysalis longicornis]|uniref:Uncharacterized protein n=1 Tax=Haemaphysalis longicornis TaxID=44386 RepID=A0A9J6G3S9_HAELO|nr:hypothetical protein HPB48_013092 [Haemaphysalis longicornis]